MTRLFFLIVNDIYTSTIALSQDLNAITSWDFQYKMVFNPDLSKQVHEVIVEKLRNCFIQLFH